MKNSLETAKAVIDDDNDEETESRGTDISIVTAKYISKLIASYNQYFRELPVIGFNSGRYDLNLIKKYITPHLLTSNADDKDDKDNDKRKDSEADGDGHVTNSMFVVLRLTNFIFENGNFKMFGHRK